MHGGERLFGFDKLGHVGRGFKRFGVLRHHGELTQTGLETLGDRHLSGDPAKDNLAGEVDPVAGQGVDDVVPGPRLDLVERFRRLRPAPSGQHRHDRKVGVRASGHGGEEPITPRP